ncbi:MAG: hypothetical protein OEV91_03895 [Desulfobulbaceae bacterium]|nr:hypothetical protein [Desulfobulbaceae bacterium]
MKKIGKPTLGLLALLLLFSLEGTAAAKNPWRWQMSIRTDAKTTTAMRMPLSLYVDGSKERYYVADSGNNRLLSFDREGKLVHTFTADNDLKAPSDMTRTEAGDLWVVEKGRSTLTLISLKDKQTVQHTVKDQGRLVFPDRLEYNNNKLYLLDKASGNILLLDQDLSVRQRYVCPAEKGNTGFVDFKVQGEEVWALEQRSNTIYRFRPDGGVAGRISLENKVHFPISLAVGTDELVYILDRLDAAVAVFDREGRFKYSFLGAGQAQGQLYYPAEVLFDPWGQLCVVDEGNGRVEVFRR